MELMARLVTLKPHFLRVASTSASACWYARVACKSVCESVCVRAHMCEWVGVWPMKPHFLRVASTSASACCYTRVSCTHSV